MGSWVGVIGALAGASIALMGQYLFKRLDRRHGDITLILEQCARLIALSEDYFNRLWEERRLGAETAVADWDYHDYQMAEARIRLLCNNDQLIHALDQLRATGKELGKAWRLTRSDTVHLQQAWDANKQALRDFTNVAGSVIQRRLR